jgi:LuxR family maltose regulon positive regulatory protein
MKDKFLLREKLTEREMHILKELSKGCSYKQIADALFISLNTVKFHMKSIYRKTELNSNTELMKYAFKNGLVDLD